MARLTYVDGLPVVSDEQLSVRHATNQQLILPSNKPDGRINRLLWFMLTGPYDRPGAVWTDPEERLRVAMYYHMYDNVSGDIETDPFHDAFEVKTSTDPGPADEESDVSVLNNPDYMKTSLQIETDVPRSKWIINFLKDMELNPGYWVPDENWGFRFRMPTEAGTTRSWFEQWIKVDPDGVPFVDLDPFPLAADGSGHIRVGRNVTTTGTIFFGLKKADGTNTDAVLMSSKGDLTVDRKLNVRDTFGSSVAGTMPPEDAISNLTNSTSGYWAVKIRAKAAGTFTQIRCSTGTGAPSAVTDLRLMVGSLTGVPTQQTGNLSAQATGANVVITGTLGSPVTLAAGEEVTLGVGWTATTGTFRGKSSSSTLMALSGRTMSGSYSGGALGNASGAATGNVPFIELVA